MNKKGFLLIIDFKIFNVTREIYCQDSLLYHKLKIPSSLKILHMDIVALFLLYIIKSIDTIFASWSHFLYEVLGCWLRILMYFGSINVLCKIATTAKYINTVRSHKNECFSEVQRCCKNYFFSFAALILSHITILKSYRNVT